MDAPTNLQDIPTILANLIKDQPGCTMMALVGGPDGFFAIVAPPSAAFIQIGLLNSALVFVEERARLQSTGLLQQMAHEDNKYTDFMAMKSDDGTKQ
jgi:hypothetical protein